MNESRGVIYTGVGVNINSEMFRQIKGNVASSSEPSNPTCTQSSMHSENSCGFKNRRIDDKDEDEDESEF